MNRKIGSSAVHGKIFLSKNVWNLKPTNGQAVERIDYACTKFLPLKAGENRYQEHFTVKWTRSKNLTKMI